MAKPRSLKMKEIFEIEFAPVASKDFDQIADYIGQDNPKRAITFILELRQAAERIRRNPFIYPLRVELGKDLRIGFHRRYVILFRVRGGIIRIERVVFGGRDLPSLFRPTQ